MMRNIKYLVSNDFLLFRSVAPLVVAPLLAFFRPSTPTTPKLARAVFYYLPILQVAKSMKNDLKKNEYDVMIYIGQAVSIGVLFGLIPKGR